MVEHSLNLEAIQHFFADALQNNDGHGGFVDGDHVDSNSLPAHVKAAYAFYKENVEYQDWGSVRVHQISVESLSTYIVEVTTDGDDGWLEIYTEMGEAVAFGYHDGEVINWGNQATIREYFNQ